MKTKIKIIIGIIVCLIVGFQIYKVTNNQSFGNDSAVFS